MEQRKIKQKKVIPTEMQECLSYWEWAQKTQTLREYLYKIVNEGKRSYIYGKKLKNIGLQKGVPDYHLPIAVGSYHGFFLEMKTRDKKDKHVSASQKLWIDKLNSVKQYAVVAFGWEDAAEKTMKYLRNEL